MAWEMDLLRKTNLRKHRHCLDLLVAYAEIAPWWQRGCLFLYASLGTWLGTEFGVDTAAIWRKGEFILEEMAAVTGLEPKAVADMLQRFVQVKLHHSIPLDFDAAKAAVYDQLFWPMVAHLAFGMQPSAVARRDFAMRVAGSIHLDRAHVGDLGCGPGVMLSDILARHPSWSGQGLDISQAAVDYAAKLAAYKKVGNRAAFSVGDLACLTFADESFDLLIVSEVLEHVPDIQKALGELSRVLRPGGKLLITVPLHSRTALHIHSLTGQEDISRFCAEAGLNIRHFETQQYLGFGDDWRHAFVVAETPGTTAIPSVCGSEGLLAALAAGNDGAGNGLGAIAENPAAVCRPPTGLREQTAATPS